MTDKTIIPAADLPTQKEAAADLSGLPEGPVDRLIRPIVAFLHIEAVSGLALVAATIAALVLANSPLAGRYFALWTIDLSLQFGSLAVTYDLRHVINDGLMTLFFFVVGMEIKRELVVGELRNPRLAALPVAAAFGGMAVPALFYLALQFGEPGERGWGIVMATDIAFVVGCLAILGTRVAHSLRVFALSLAIIDDIGAVLVITFVYSADLNTHALALGMFFIAIAIALRRLGVRNMSVYFAVGIFAWLAVDRSGLHPTIVGVVLGLLTPTRPWVAPQRFRAVARRVSTYFLGETSWHPEARKREEVDLLRNVALAARETLSPLERLENTLHPWVSFAILPLFAFANAGVTATAPGLSSSLIPAIVAGLVLGKPIGHFRGKLAGGANGCC
jgi:NhaA family Na+:H+ antiporter